MLLVLVASSAGREWWCRRGLALIDRNEGGRRCGPPGVSAGVPHMRNAAVEAPSAIIAGATTSRPIPRLAEDSMQLQGIHHISAITGDAARNVDFYTRVLGLRLVAKTVNQDDPGVYHLFYADERGRPGAEMTFFEYPHAKPGRAGAGMVHTIVWRVASEDALGFWQDRLAGLGVDAVRTDKGRVRFADPEGLAHELTVNATA